MTILPCVGWLYRVRVALKGSEFALDSRVG